MNLLNWKGIIQSSVYYLVLREVIFLDLGQFIEKKMILLINSVYDKFNSDICYMLVGYGMGCVLIEVF